MAGDEVYGANTTLRAELETRGVGSVFAVARDHHVLTATGSQRADYLVNPLPKRAMAAPLGGQGS